MSQRIKRRREINVTVQSTYWAVGLGLICVDLLQMGGTV